MNNPNAGRSSIMAVAGGYLLYLAYQLLKSRIDNEPTTMSLAVSIIFIVLFTGIGIFLLFYAWKLWKQGREGKKEDQVIIPDETEQNQENQTKE